MIVPLFIGLYFGYIFAPKTVVFPSCYPRLIIDLEKGSYNAKDIQKVIDKHTCLELKDGTIIGTLNVKNDVAFAGDSMMGDLNQLVASTSTKSHIK